MANDPSHAAADHAADQAGADHTGADHTAADHAGDHYHPSWKEYKWVALILLVITVAEVWSYYIPEFVASRVFVPLLLIMSAVKFAIVVMYYMHLKYDHRLFRALFTGPLTIAVLTIIGLMFLFSKIAIRLAGGGT